MVRLRRCSSDRLIAEYSKFTIHYGEIKTDIIAHHKIPLTNLQSTMVRLRHALRVRGCNPCREFTIHYGEIKTPFPIAP